jgi:hypothetical protein
LPIWPRILPIPATQTSSPNKDPWLERETTHEVLPCVNWHAYRKAHTRRPPAGRMSVAWDIARRDYNAEAQAATVDTEPAAAHPLQVPDTDAASAAPSAGRPVDEGPRTEVQAAPAPTQPSDPLSSALAEADFDPLRASFGGLRLGAGPLDDNPIGVSDRSIKTRDGRKPPGAPTLVLCCARRLALTHSCCDVCRRQGLVVSAIRGRECDGAVGCVQAADNEPLRGARQHHGQRPLI